MKKIILDARKLNDYGIGEYIKNLFPSILNSENFESKIIISNEENINPNLFGELDHNDIIKVRSPNYSLREHFEIPKAVSQFSDYYYFSPHYVFPYFLKNRLIITIHDLIHFKFPQYFKPGIKVKIAGKFIKKIKNSGSKVFTVSENSRNDLVDIFGFEESSINVIHNGLPDIFFNFKKGANPKPFPYIMYTGNFKPHKNLEALLKAFRIINEKFPSLRLVLAGVEKNKELFRITEKYGITNKIIPTGYIQVEELLNLLDFSEFFVFPSLYEGFGFPPLEAMSRKKAVISTRCGSLGEVLEDSALYFDPASHDELVLKIEKLLTDTSLRSEYEEKGYLHSTKFTMKKMVSQYLDHLKNLQDD